MIIKLSTARNSPDYRESVLTHSRPSFFGCGSAALCLLRSGILTSLTFDLLKKFESPRLLEYTRVQLNLSDALVLGVVFKKRRFRPTASG